MTTNENKNSVFKKNKSFAFVENQDSRTQKEENVEKFVQNGRGQNKFIPNPKGRPKLSDEVRKKESILVYLTKEQKEELKERAMKNNLPLGRYVLLKLFNNID